MVSRLPGSDPRVAGVSSRTIARRTLLALALIAVGWALLVALTGGFDLRPAIPFKSTEPDRPTYAALILIALYVTLFPDDSRRRLDHLEARAMEVKAGVERWSTAIAILLAVAVFGIGVFYSIPVAGGSDSYGYISQVDRWLARDIVVEQPISRQVPWPEPDRTFAPLGYRPGPEAGTIVPVYAAGLPLLMALAKLLVGICGVYAVVPMLGASLVWSTYALGRQVASAAVGVVAAGLMATSPVFLFMLFNPMSDVPVSACHLAALVIALTPWRHRAFWAGAAASLAILVRPNTAPLGALVAAVVIARASGERWRSVMLFALGGLPLMLVLAWINRAFYGAPWRVGYGSIAEYYHWSYFLTNLRQYSGMFLRTETPLVLLAAVPFVLIRRVTADHRRSYLYLAAFVGVVWLCYVFYVPYDVWWYLRFLLPSFPVVAVLSAAGAAWVVVRLGGKRATLLAVVLAIPLFAFRIKHARDHDVLTLWLGSIVYVSAAEYVRTRLPSNALIVTTQHSGSMRYYSDRMTLRWDLIDPAWWPRMFDELVERGYRPYLLVSSFEEDVFRKHFGLGKEVEAPGTVVAEMTAPEAVRLYDPLRLSAGTDTMPQFVPCACGFRGR